MKDPVHVMKDPVHIIEAVKNATKRKDSDHVVIDMESTEPLVSSVSPEPLPVGLTVVTHGVNETRGLEKCEPLNALHQDSKEWVSFWIDLKMDTADEQIQQELREWLADNLNLPHFISRRLVEDPMSEWHPGIITAGDTNLIVMRVSHYDGRDTLQYEAVLLLQNLFVSFTSIKSVEALEYMQDPECLVDATSSGGLLLTWLTFHVDQATDQVQILRKKIINLDQVVEDDPGNVSKEQLHSLKSSLLQFVSVAEDQSEAVEALSIAKQDKLGDTRGAFGMLIATAKSNEQKAKRLEKRLASIRQTYDSYLQGKLNNRLALLTMVSTTILPLSLGAGIYGMNFVNMPELSWWYSYYVFLICGACLVATLMCYFRRAGWCDLE